MKWHHSCFYSSMRGVMSVVLHNFDAGQKSQVLLFEEKLKSEGMHFELATLYRAQGNFVGAVAELKTLINKSPNFSYKLTLADTYVESKSYEQALVHIDQLLKYKNFDISILYAVKTLKIECLIQLSEIHEALAEIELQILSYSEDELLAWKAVAYMKLNDFDEALNFYEKSVQKNNSNEKSWVGIGSIHCIKGDYELGVACFKKALDFNNENIAALALIKKFSINCEV